MVCKNCGVETTGISLNGKLYCSQCGENLGINAPPKSEEKKEIFEAKADAKDDIEVYTPPTAKHIADESRDVEKESVKLMDAELSVLDAIATTPEAPNISESTRRELEKLKATEATVDRLTAEYFRPKEDSKPKTTPTSEISPAQRGDATTESQNEPAKAAKMVIKHNRPRVSKLGASVPIARKPVVIGGTTIKAEQIQTKQKDEAPATIAKPKEDFVPKTEPAQTIETATPPASQTPEGQNDIPTAITFKPVPREQPPDEPAENTPSDNAKASPSTPQEITQKPSGLSINLIQNEKGYCVKCKAEKEILAPEDIILKNGHPAIKGKCPTCGTSIFKIKKGEIPDSYRKKNKHHKSSRTNFLTAFLRETATNKNQGRLESKKKSSRFDIEPKEQDLGVKKKPKKKSHWKLLLFLIIPLLLILGFVGLVFYINQYAANGELAKIKAENNVSFMHKKPTYLPPGYEVSYKTTSSSDKISYVYNYAPDSKKEININISESALTSETMASTLVKPKNQTFTSKKINNTEVWFVSDNAAYFILENKLYEIISSDKISEEEMVKIVNGLL